MSARQSFEVGSQWPLYAPEAYFELRMLRYAVERGFQPHKLVKKRQDKHRSPRVYEIGCSHPDCPFSVTLHNSTKLAECITTDVNLVHNHPFIVADGTASKTVEKAAGKVMAAAKAELKASCAPADYREGFEKEEAKDVLLPSCEQECVLWDLRDVWGEGRARELEKAFREEGLLAHDYPNPSTFDGPHPLTGPREKRLTNCVVKALVKVDLESQKPGDDRQLRRRKPGAPKKRFPKNSSAEDDQEMSVQGKRRAIHITPPTIPPFLHSTKNWDLQALEQSLETYTCASGFSTKKHSSDSPRLTYSCTVASCGWQIVLKPQFGLQGWLLDGKASDFAHRHEAGPGNGKVQTTVEKKKPENHSDPSTFRLPDKYKLPVRKIAVESVAVRYEDGPDDEIFAVDPRVLPRTRQKHTPQPGRGKAIQPAFVPAPTLDDTEDDVQEKRLHTFVAQPSTPDSPYCAVGAVVPPAQPCFVEYSQPASWYGYSPQQCMSYFPPGQYAPPVLQTPAYTQAAVPYSPYPAPLSQPVQPAALEEYLANLDPQSLFNYSTYAPVLRRAGVNDGAQLERIAEAHLDKVEKVLKRSDNIDELILEAFIDDLKERVEEKQARSRRSEAPLWCKESESQ
ncbi:hypothetical protein Rt10032_c16g5724 [Rhodotorula toruloides]|uniref:Proteophosphoglycan ppg4 n=1 Tax=Rhodotorula toruloides TaxID=5286 RepID=A0A511KMY6_RHOTO|nr:hypothetical protein Rt10032_c16g5724 [Rhodotorula toruloides]